MNSKFCIFHDKDHYAEHEQEATKRIEVKIRESITDNKPLECFGYHLPAINFAELLERKRFEQPVYFIEGTFYNGASFRDITFSKIASFKSAKFKYADFSNATFSEKADFIAVIFSQSAYFSRTTFSKGADFYGAKFEIANFSNATFNVFISFHEATFSNEANFLGAKFLKPASFYSATFNNEANFSNGNFFGGGNFSKAKFLKPATFYNVVFNGADFGEADFSDIASFLESTFYTRANFSKAKFKSAGFTRIKFSGRADFFGSVFSGRADFFGSVFSKEANFYDAKFFGYTHFSGTRFLADVIFRNNAFVGKILFRGTSFEQQNKVAFNNSNLSNVSFADSDITKIRFGDNIEWGGKDKFTIIEEEWLKYKAKGWRLSGYETVSLGLALSVYRSLRENYEFRLRYDEAGKFFIKEMELKRKYGEVPAISNFKLKLIALDRKLKGDKSPLPKVIYHLKENCWLRQHLSLTGLYYHLSRYGESISRPAAIGAITVLLSTLFWVTQSNPTLEPHFDPSLEAVGNSTFVGFREVGNPSQWLESLERSLAGFIPLLSLGGETKVGIIDYIIKIFGGGLTFVLLAIALRRKFERKYTR